MRKSVLLILLVAAFLTTACGKSKPGTFDSPVPTPAVGVANPASKYCVDQGYRLEIRTAADGSQTGYCIFPDGTECEEWAFYRGECKPSK